MRDANQNDKIVIVCGPNPITEGSAQVECSQCHATIWASPATMEKARENDHVFLCMNCVPHVKKSDVMRPTEAQRAEIRRELGRDVSDEEINLVIGRIHKFLSSRNN